MKNRKFGGKNAVCKSKFSKFALGALIVASITSSAVADGLFVGAEAKYNLKSKFSTSWDTGFATVSVDTDDSPFALGLKVGYDFDLFRVYGAINHNFEAKDSVVVIGPLAGVSVPEEFKWSGNDFVLGADWTPKFSLAGLDFKGALGAFAGISKIDVEYYMGDNIGSFSADYSQNGFIYGAKLGAIYDLEKMGEIEFGLKFDQAKYSDKDFQLKECGGGTCISNPATAKDTKRTNIGVFVGYNYKF